MTATAPVASVVAVATQDAEDVVEMNPRIVIAVATVVVFSTGLSMIVSATVNNFGHQMPSWVAMLLAVCYFVGAGLLGWMMLDWVKKGNRQ